MVYPDHNIVIGTIFVICFALFMLYIGSDRCCVLKCLRFQIDDHALTVFYAYIATVWYNVCFNLLKRLSFQTDHQFTFFHKVFGLVYKFKYYSYRKVLYYLCSSVRYSMFSKSGYWWWGYYSTWQTILNCLCCNFNMESTVCECIVCVCACVSIGHVLICWM